MKPSRKPHDFIGDRASQVMPPDDVVGDIYEERTMSTPTIITDPGYDVAIPPEPPGEPDEKREWLLVALGLTAFVAIIAIAIALVGLAKGGDGTTTVAPSHPAAAKQAGSTLDKPAPTLAQSKGVALE